MDRVRSLRERQSLRVRLVAGFATLLLTILLLGINSIFATRDMSRQGAELYRMELLGISRIKEANIDLILTGRALRQMVLAPTFVDRDEARAQLEQAMLDLKEELAAVRPSIVRDQEKRLLNEFELEFEHYRRNVNDAITLIDRRFDYQQKATAYISGEQFNQVADSADQLLHRIVAIKEEGARETADAMAQHSRDTQWLTLCLLLGSLLVGTVVAVLIARSMKQPVDRLYNPLDNLAKGDAGDRIPLVGYRKEFDAEEQSIAGPHIAPIKQVSILVVGANESNQEVTVGLLAHTDCTVTVASSGQEALALLEKNPYDVVLMNMQEPMRDGLNAAAEIRKKTAFDRVPIIAMTANATHQDRERCLDAGMDGHIAKPVNPDALYSALMCWISPDARYVDNSAVIES